MSSRWATSSDQHEPKGFRQTDALLIWAVQWEWGHSHSHRRVQFHAHKLLIFMGATVNLRLFFMMVGVLPPSLTHNAFLCNKAADFPISTDYRVCKFGSCGGLIWRLLQDFDAPPAGEVLSTIPFILNFPDRNLRQRRLTAVVAEHVNEEAFHCWLFSFY